MSISLDGGDIRQIDINYTERNENAEGYGVVFLRNDASDIKAFHFTFVIDINEFCQRAAMLEIAASEQDFVLNIHKKSQRTMGLEIRLVSTLIGTEYRNLACPSCKLINIFMVGIG